MKLSFIIATLLYMAWSTDCRADDPISAEIDASVWNLISRTVVDNDIVEMAGAYHSDAVLVTQNATFPISTTLARWGKDMEEMAIKDSSAEVSFRFSQRMDNTETALESGMFRYVLTDSEGTEQVSIFAFEALLAKKDGQWKILMERQLKEVDEVAWSAE